MRVTFLTFDGMTALDALGGYEVLARVPGLEVEFCQTLSIVVAEPPTPGEPPSHHRDGYFALRRFHMLQGLQLLDVILVDSDLIQSLAIACDPDPIWFEDFDPADPPLVPPDDVAS